MRNLRRRPSFARTNDLALEEIAFATGDTELGAVLIARSSVGVCSIIMGSDGDELSDDLAERFPECKLVRDNAKLADDLHQVQRFIETPALGLDVVFDVRGTPFQRRVWTELLGVPAGSTITYAALASRIGERNAVRAVARVRRKRDRAWYPVPPRHSQRRQARSQVIAGVLSGSVHCRERGRVMNVHSDVLKVFASTPLKRVCHQTECRRLRTQTRT